MSFDTRVYPNDFHCKQSNSKNRRSEIFHGTASNKALKGASKSKNDQTQEIKQFDPNSVLEGRKVTEKSKLSDMVLFAIIRISNSSKENEASVTAIKKHLGELFDKKCCEKNNKVIYIYYLGGVVNNYFLRLLTERER